MNALVAEGRRLIAEATKLPWEAAECGLAGEIPEIIRNEPDGSDWVPVAYFTDARGDGRADNVEANRPLIVLAVNALPALLDVAEAGERLLAYHDNCGMESTHGDVLRAALAKLKEVK